MPESKKPWPMRWIVLAILVFVVGYTWISLAYRKPGKPSEPYQDAKDRATVHRLLSAGYQRVLIPAVRPADPQKTAAQASAAETRAHGPGLPELLRDSLVDSPRIPDAYLSVSAPGTANSLAPVPIQITCRLPDLKVQLGGAHLYLRGSEAVLVPEFEPIRGELLARTNESTVLLTIPAGTLGPGRYEVILPGRAAGKTWSLEVR